MWGEALQNFKRSNGKRMGEPVDINGSRGRKHHRTSSFEAIDMIPRDIVMLDWCYSMSNNSEDEFLERGIKEIYGNFSATTFLGYDKRRKKQNVMGGKVSAWCVADENEYGRNGWIFEYAFAAELLWGNSYTDKQHNELMFLTAEKMKTLRKIIRGEDIRAKRRNKLITCEKGIDYIFSIKNAPDYTIKALGKIPKNGKYISIKNENNEFFADKEVGKLLADNYIIYYKANHSEKIIYVIRIIYVKRNLDEILHSI